ncbi:MAG: hypothetical protein H7A33_05235 [Deltaproteobacteria bacterium]|nr:hypothetical protein [Deltaproteobacteria bacterium]
MKEKHKVISSYTSAYPDPLNLKKDDLVTTLHEDSEWPGWIKCICEKTKKQGWIPKIYLNRLNHNQAVLNCDYLAKELTVHKDETVTTLLEESGWIWCKNQKGEEGWIPKRNLDKLFN